MVFILSSLCCGNMHDWKFGSGKMFTQQDKFFLILIIGMRFFLQTNECLVNACDSA